VFPCNFECMNENFISLYAVYVNFSLVFTVYESLYLYYVSKTLVGLIVVKFSKVGFNEL
jgi:hypothetical protein